MQKFTFNQKLRYRFDNLMSKGSSAMISLLGIISLILVLIAASVIAFGGIYPEGSEEMSFIESAWQSLMRTLDAGTVCGDMGWPFRIVAFAVTVGGIFIFSTLIGVLSNGINDKLENLRKGKSFVIESDHTIILGWSSKIFTIISELVIANENRKNAAIVILADMDKVEMEDEIKSKISNFKNTKIICRNGSPDDMSDLAIVNTQNSRSIIILSPEDEEHSDSIVIKTILAITNNPQRREAPYHIIAEMKDEKNIQVARMVGKDELELVQSDEIIGKIMVQTSRQSGLSIVYTELLDFDGAEIYFNEEKSLVGKTYADAIFAYEESTIIGICHKDNTVKINPAMETILEVGDKVIAITEDDDTLIVSKNAIPAINNAIITQKQDKKLEPERILMLGWNERALVIIKEMDNYVAPKSYMKVVSNFENNEIPKLAKTLKNIQLEFELADTSSREVLDELKITNYDSVQLLCYKDEMDMQEADAQTLISLLHIRSILEIENKDIKVVSEMLDLRNRDLAEVTKADDFIVSDKLISLLLSQVSENKHLMRVFDDLFNAEGSEIYLKPANEYIKENQETDFYTLLESAKQKGETAIGYRIAALHEKSDAAYGVVINPKKSDKFKLTAEDKVVVLAED